MSRAADHLMERVRSAYEAQETKDLRALISPTTVEALELTSLEARVLVALLIAGGVFHEVRPLVWAPGGGPSSEALVATLTSLQNRGLIEPVQPYNGNYTFEGLVRALRPQDPEEAEQAASPKLVLRPLRTRMLLLARDAETPIRGLARVYAYIFGAEPTGQDWGILGLYVKELGLDRAVAFFVEHAGDVLEKPLHQLLPLARGIAKNLRPLDGGPPPEEDDWRARLFEQALRGRLQMYRRSADPAAEFGEGYRRDVEAARRLGIKEV
jgi:hypothetical protein